MQKKIFLITIFAISAAVASIKPADKASEIEPFCIGLASALQKLDEKLSGRKLPFNDNVIYLFNNVEDDFNLGNKLEAEMDATKLKKYCTAVFDSYKEKQTGEYPELKASIKMCEVLFNKLCKVDFEKSNYYKRKKVDFQNNVTDLILDLSHHKMSPVLAEHYRAKTIKTLAETIKLLPENLIETKTEYSKDVLDFSALIENYSNLFDVDDKANVEAEKKISKDREQGTKKVDDAKKAYLARGLQSEKEKTTELSLGYKIASAITAASLGFAAFKIKQNFEEISEFVKEKFDSLKKSIKSIQGKE